MTIGIIGAGICGLMAARELTKNGYQVWLIDKARGAGGRMATRRIDNAVFDHGAQFFTSRSEEFSALVTELQKAQVTHEWYRGYPSPMIHKSERYPRFCGVQGMTDVPKFLAQDLSIHLNEVAQGIDWIDEKWHVESSVMHYKADALICTPPVAQSLELFKGNFQLPDAAQLALQKVTYEPCWAVLAQLDGPSQIPPPGALHLENGPLSWIADNHQKGISPQPVSVSIHANGNWTQEHFEDEPQQVIQLLLQAAHDYLGAEVISAQAHRWRYAKPLVTHDAPFYHVGHPAPLFFAGDAFVSPGAGPRVEGAALSGLAAARALHELFTTSKAHS